MIKNIDPNPGITTKKLGGLLATTLLVCSTPSAFCGVTTEATASKSVIQAPEENNPFSLLDDRVIFDMQERARLEDLSNNFTFNRAVNSPTDGDWLQQRFRLGVTVKPADWLSVYAQGQDSLEVGAVRPRIPGALGAEGDDAFDLHQAYVKLGNLKAFPATLTIGRQTLSYGDERLVGAFDWNNFGRVFDAAKLHIEQPGWWLDAFSSSVVTIKRNRFSQSDLFNGNYGNRDLIFSGIYFETNASKYVTWDVYTFLLDQANGNDSNQQGTLTLAPAGASAAQGGNSLKRSDFFTVGTRVVGDPLKLGGFEYNGEFAGQDGRVAGLQLLAGAAHAGIGYNFLSVWSQPRIWAEYDYASGSGSPSNHKDNTFQNLFPTNHNFYGYMDLFSWQNMQQTALSLRIKPLPKVTFQVDGRACFAANTEDSWYRANGLTTVRPLNAAAQSASTYEGSELDLTATYKPLKQLAFQAGYSHFWAGDYLKDTGAHSDADFVYAMTTITF